MEGSTNNVLRLNICSTLCEYIVQSVLYMYIIPNLRFATICSQIIKLDENLSQTLRIEHITEVRSGISGPFLIGSLCDDVIINIFLEQSELISMVGCQNSTLKSGSFKKRVCFYAITINTSKEKTDLFRLFSVNFM